MDYKDALRLGIVEDELVWKEVTRLVAEGKERRRMFDQSVLGI